MTEFCNFCEEAHSMPKMLSRLTDGDMAAHGGQYFYRVVIHELGHGHAEGSITPYKTLSEPPLWFGQPDPDKGPPNEEENGKRAARRAATMVRRKCKIQGFDSLFTFTYQQNVTDRDLVVAHWEAFVRRARTVLPSFEYVAVLERQKRGAWHIHVATHRLPFELENTGGVKVKSWNLMRAMWRRVVGELGGNFDEQKRKLHARSRTHKIARYISKYVSKAFAEAREGAKWEKRFFSSKGTVVPRPRVLLVSRKHDGVDAMGGLIAWLFDEIAPGNCETHTVWVRDKGIFWMSSEAPS